MKVLFQRPYFARRLGWDRLARLPRHPRVIGTPHVGGLTGHMFYRSSELLAGNLRRWAAGEAPRWAVNAPPSLRGPGQAS
ncbi:MAG: hypothetical protein ABR922_22590 [Streptosporangiaceae bacterium]